MAARSGMTAIIEELRTMTEAGTAEYTVGTTSYWSDNALQDILDIHRVDVIHNPLIPYPVVGSGGTSLYYDYRSTFGFWEQTTGGTAIFYVQNGGGTTVGTALYTPDYRRGQITFSSDTTGSALYITGRSYDLYAAAANIWRKKAAHYAPTSFDFSTDNHTVSRSKVYEHCLQMASYFDGQGNSAIESVEMTRGDMY